MSSATLAPTVNDHISEDAVAILLVDDDPKNLTALESILECPEHRLTKARTASEALMALMNQNFAAIVLDVQMPEMSGIDLARLIKQRKKTQHIPILFLTAHYRENEDVVQGYDVGAVDYLTKPVHPAVLRSKVGVFVDLFRKTRALAEVNRAMEMEIVERKTAEERFRVVVEAAPSAMLVFTSDGVLDLVNSQAERLFGRSREEMLITARIHDLVDSSALPLMGDTPSGSPVEMVVRDKAGRLIPVEASFTTIHSVENGRWLASFVDITERKRSEESLRRVNSELEAKNVALEKQAEERNLRLKAESAQAEAEAANAAKDRFLAMLSHELRTPLSPVLHAVTMLNDTPHTSTETRDLLQTIRRNVLLEARLIDDLLDLARVRNGKLQLDLQPTDAHQLMSHALEICGPEITAHQLKIETHLNAASSGLRADPARIQQIFWNLINNSIKHTQPGGTITIDTSNDETAGTVQIRVTDVGSGIEKEKLSRIFDAFEQGAHEASKGLGLGLAISKALAEFHGGTISAHSEGLGKGASFVVTLPVAKVSGVVNVPQPGDAGTRSKPLRLLVVDDHRDTVVTLRALLLRRGYEVRSAESVTSALEAAEGFPFDVLVTDIGLPDGSGVNLFERLREKPAHSAIRGVAVSGFGMDEDIERSKGAGFAEHLTKPIDFSLLERCLARMACE